VACGTVPRGPDRGLRHRSGATLVARLSPNLLREARSGLGGTDVVGPLHLLLALEHLRVNGSPLDEHATARLTADSLFSREDVELVFGRVHVIDLYMRATLPHRCYNCGTSDFDYGTLRCRCADLYDEADSMSAVLQVAV